MELKVESVDGYSLPANCFIGVRVGDVLKQGRYEPHRCYHFPQLERRRNAKVDIYQHVGTCIVAVDPDTKSSHEVAVTSMDPSLPGTRIRINVAAKAEDSRQNREERAKALKAQARDYLMKHNIEERLSEAVKALLKEQPLDPTAYLCKHLSEGDLTAPPKAAQPAPAAEEELPSAELPCAVPAEDDSVNEIRKSARETFLKAGEDGSLERALLATRGGQTREADPDALRKSARDTLLKASEDGSLEQALIKNTRGGQVAQPNREADPNALRKSARDTLLKASEDGSLEQALIKNTRGGQVAQPTEEDGKKASREAIRAKASNVLITAAGNGELEKALAVVKKDTVTGNVDNSKEAAEQPQSKDTSKELREKAANLLSQAARTGQLEVALQDMKPTAGSGDKEPADEPVKEPVSQPAAQPKQELPDTPPVMVADLAVTAPTFVSFGMQPGFLFI